MGGGGGGDVRGGPKSSQGGLVERCKLPQPPNSFLHSLKPFCGFSCTCAVYLGDTFY